jgi:hypothetical protein
MKRRFALALVVGLSTMLVADAGAQFDEDTVSFRPEFGMGYESSAGLLVGGVVTYGVTDFVAVGPVYGFTTAGRRFGAGDAETEASSSMYFGGRVFFQFFADYDFPWYVDTGLGVVKFGAIDKLKNGNPIVLRDESGNPVQVDEIKSASRIAFNLGAGGQYPVGEELSMTIDLNSWIGSHGDPVVRTGGQEATIANADNGTFFLLTLAVGVEFYL